MIQLVDLFAFRAGIAIALPGTIMLPSLAQARLTQAARYAAFADKLRAETAELAAQIERANAWGYRSPTADTSASTVRP